MILEGWTWAEGGGGGKTRRQTVTTTTTTAATTAATTKTCPKPTSDFLGHPQTSGGLQGPGLPAVSEEEGAVVGPLTVGRVLAARATLPVLGQQ